ncbi:MAG TPA: STAS domain-containing protein [Nitrospira sp.]|nr:STAS domain-containing protein [Nitrospira sp.]
MEISERKVGDVCIVQITGRLEWGTSDNLAERLHHLIDGGERRLVIDGEKLDYITSTGLRVLLVAAKRLKAVEGRIVLSSLKPHIIEVFEIAGFTSIFPIYGNAEQAMQQTSEPLNSSRYKSA